MAENKLAVPFSVKESSPNGEFTGLASTFGNVDLGGDIVMRGAFTKTLREHQEGGTPDC